MTDKTTRHLLVLFGFVIHGITSGYSKGYRWIIIGYTGMGSDSVTARSYDGHKVPCEVISDCRLGYGSGIVALVLWF